MRILLLCEQRSGSTNLANWFLLNKNFTVLFEPVSNPDGISYKHNVPPLEWEYSTKYLLIKETFFDDADFEELIEISDKIICLYRENEKEQMESFANCIKTWNWDRDWVYYTNDFYISDDIQNLYKKLKIGFNKKYLSRDYFKISYEELYYNNGLQKILEYLNIPELKNKNFPYGKKYRIDAIKTKKFI